MSESRPYETSEGWLNVEKILNELIGLGFIIGNRSVGKTYGFLNYSVKRSLAAIEENYDISTLEEFEKLPQRLESNWQFMFLRRTITQSKAAARRLIMPDFYKEFVDNLDKEITEKYEHSIEYEGSVNEIRDIYLVFREKENRKNKRMMLIGYASQVTSAEKIRGPGFPSVKLIIFDEFQAKKIWDYLANEPVELQDIYDSVTRNREGDCKLVALGNAGTILNPYFSYYDYDEFDELKTEKRNGTVIFYHLDNVAKRGSLYNDMVSGTKYADYAMKNEYKDMEDFNLLKLEDAEGIRKNVYNVILGQENFGVWKDSTSRLILSRRYDPEKVMIVDRIPIAKEHFDEQIYISLAAILKNKRLYFDAADIRLIAEKHLRKYIFKNNSEWQTI